MQSIIATITVVPAGMSPHELKYVPLYGIMAGGQLPSAHAEPLELGKTRHQQPPRFCNLTLHCADELYPLIGY